MKRKILLLMLLVSFTICPLPIKANERFINNYGIDITEEDNQRLLSLGFTQTEIINMDQNEYMANDNLYGEVVSESMSMPLLRDTVTDYKIMKTSILKLNSGNYRYRIDLIWNKIPKVRSYDVIGIGIENNVKITSGVTSSLNYKNSNALYKINSVYTNQSSNGVYSVFALPTGTINEMNLTLYFDVQVTSGSSLNAYGDYSHAIKTISLTNAKKATIKSSGISFPSDITSYYDNIAVSKTVYYL